MKLVELISHCPRNPPSPHPCGKWTVWVFRVLCFSSVQPWVRFIHYSVFLKEPLYCLFQYFEI
jgi:hypothetical protein